jgi:hypothetical protein
VVDPTVPLTEYNRPRRWRIRFWTQMRGLHAVSAAFVRGWKVRA